MASPVEYLVELEAHNGTSVVTLRYGRFGRTTLPGDTPAHTEYSPRLVSAGRIRRAILGDGTQFGRAQIAVGEILLSNADGALDGLAGYGFDGRTATVKRGLPTTALASFETVFVGTMEDVELTADTMRVRLRDNARLLDVPLQTTLYAGDNALPDGLEGVDDLEGKPKPLLFGQARNIPAVPVNTAKLIYQVSDGAVASVQGIYDRGIPIHEDAWTSLGGSNDTDLSLVRSLHYVEPLALYIAVGVGGDFIATSSDFASWSFATGAAANCNRAAWCPDIALVVVVGDGGVIYTSTNGTAYTSRTSGTTDDLRGVAYGAGLAVAVGENGTLLTSPDGITWTPRTSSFGSDFIRSVVYGAGQFVAVGYAGKIATSPDGITWTQRTSGTTENLLSVEFGYAPDGSAQWVAGGENSALTVSKDGVVWAARVDPSSTFKYNITYGNGLWYASGASSFLIRSRDGVEWRQVTVPGSGGNIFAVAYDGRYFRCGNQSGFVASNTSLNAYADATDLEDDTLAPGPGSARVYLSASGSYLRLGSPPAGLITVDATHGATAADRTAARIFAAVLTKAGYTSADWVAADLTALDALDDGVCGLWTFDDRLRVGEALDLLAATVGAWWGTDRLGRFRIAQWTAPSGSPVLTLTANDIADLERLPSEVPSTRTTLQYARHYAVQPSDVAFGVSDARRAQLAREWREVTATDAAVATKFALARDTREPTLYANAADAQAEATRRQTLRGVKHSRFTITCQLTAEVDALDFGAVITLQHPRFGLSAGVLARVLAIEPVRADDRLRLTVWSAA